ncbi:MAG: TIGR02099 family protein [Burkholderiales bacterium]|nr:TIGR02099 family protein [Burkholderiales bacterium]
MWITLAVVWGGLHFVIVPRIGELRPWLEQQASSALGITVRIGSIVARSNGLIPSVEMVDLRLLDPQGREALHLPHVLAALSPRSALSLSFEQLYVEGPVLDVRRTADGRFWVAGLELPKTAGDSSAAADWVFSQAEMAVRHGTVRWTDEMRGAPTLELNDVDVVLRNRHLSHALRIDANPPPEWGERLSLSGVFKQPLLSRGAGRWRDWQGQLYAQFPRVDVVQLRRYVDLGVDVAQGAGVLRAWVDVRRGEWTGATADVAMEQVNVRVSPKLEPVTLSTVSGRLGARRLEGGYEFFTEALAFQTLDGLHWPGGNVRVALFDAQGRNPARGEIAADRLDLAAMVEIAQRLPIDEAAQQALTTYAPKGLVEQLQASWLGPIASPERYAVKGRVARLEVAAQPAPLVMPGVQGINLDFDVNQVAGKASISMTGGLVDLPGVFEDPVIHLDQLAGDVQWKLEGERIQVSASSLRFANADAQGEAQFKWQTAQAPAGVVSHHGRFPGILDLQGTLSRADGTRLHRYLPQALGGDVRKYLREAVQAGTASNVKFRLKGDLRTFPYADARQGDFRISADVKNATFAYAPAFLLPKDSMPWPALTQLSGELVIDHNVLQVKGARGVLGVTGMQFSKAEAVLSNLYDKSMLSVTAEGKGPLGDALALVNGSPLGGMMGKALARASAAGPADFRLKLGFPLAAVERATVQGAVVLAGNDVQISPETPRLARLRGTVAFNENGFSVSGAQARALGGDVRIEGGLTVAAPGTAAAAKSPTTLRIQGTATADGLRQARELGFAARLAQYATGSATYQVVLGLRQGIPELLISSPLAGLALNLPAPFAKPAEATLPVRVETTAVRNSLVAGAIQQDQLQMEVGRLASIRYVRDVSGADARVLRGAIGIGLAGDESAPMPDTGVVANINLAAVDVDAWTQLLGKVSGTDVPTPQSTNQPGMAYLPTSMAVRARELTVGSRKFNNIVIGGSREGQLWRANLDATQLSGYVEYRQSTGPAAGRLYARLARLVIGQSTAQEVENLLDEQPTSIPALDVVVEDLELRGKKLGRIEIDAVNLAAGASQREAAREWRLNRFNIITPEAVLTADGNWTTVATPSAAATGRSIKERRRTLLNFKLDIADAGDVLVRMGMSSVVRKGKGKIEGQVAWLGSPITLDYPSMAGNFHVNVENGQFLKADPGIAKLLGVLSLQSLPRRLVLDFRDVFSEGFAFDFLRGDVTIEQGIARTNNLQMKGVNAAVLMEGQADIARETQMLKVVVVPEINAGSASLLTAVINPLVGLTTFLAQAILRRPLIEANTQEFLVDGTWVDPRVTRVEHKSAP